MIPDDPEALLSRDATAAALTAAGFPTAASTLATKATRGGGPEYMLFGRKPIYKWRTSLAWAKARLSEPVSNTSQSEGRHAA